MIREMPLDFSGYRWDDKVMLALIPPGPPSREPAANARRNFSRREMLGWSAGSLLALGFWPGALRAEGKGNSGEFNFIAVNDLHYLDDRCGPWFERVVGQMKANSLSMDFCLIGGDWTEKGTTEALTKVRDIFKRLGVPAYGVIGNHDYVTQTDRKAYEEIFPGRLNYYFEHRGWQFVALDSSEGQHSRDTTIQPATFQWLDDTLPKLDKQRPMVIVTHFPLGPLTPSRPKNAEALLERFKEYNLQAVYNGHFHGFTERKVGATTLTTNRCCAFSRNNHDGTKEKGYFVCRAKDGKITREFVEVKAA